ncbi:Uncharacterized conserved protein [Legionella wadsworthii]|uniref:Uncharacterized conserved protein n=1 Tax=Legionella wadsworthii TaxID=28088 RepID=A0A378LNQ9_9GAMM|nr:DUF488 domain-containing protein [Legionella wadsworthii]STY28556.1 Uncharacterized conserved protein [Legionella wadsworthii]
MPELFTVGHSTRSYMEFVDLIKAHQINHIIDVRTIPKSRTVPWFNKEEFAKSLAHQKVAYTHLAKLGGLRKTDKNSINMGWRNASFRGFADYMQTENFREGLEELNEILTNFKGAILCAEAVPWRCHRSLISDAELVRGYTVWHIMSKTTANLHHLTSFAVVDKSQNPIRIYYP